MVTSAVFAAVGTAGQRCTTLRRLIVHEDLYDEVLEKLKKSYASIMTRMGDPLDDGTLYGPMHSKVFIFFIFIESTTITLLCRLEWTVT